MRLCALSGGYDIAIRWLDVGRLRPRHRTCLWARQYRWSCSSSARRVSTGQFVRRSTMFNRRIRNGPHAHTHAIGLPICARSICNALKIWIPSRPVLKHGPRSLACVRVIGQFPSASSPVCGAAMCPAGVRCGKDLLSKTQRHN